MFRLLTHLNFLILLLVIFNIFLLLLIHIVINLFDYMYV
jgi:hypothetical protein